MTSTGQNAGTRTISAEPNPSVSGSARIVTASPKRRSAWLVANSWTTKLTVPSASVNVPLKRVSAVASLLKYCDVTRLNCSPVHWVTIAVRHTTAAISRRYGLARIARAVCSGRGGGDRADAHRARAAGSAVFATATTDGGQGDQQRQDQQQVDRAAERLDQHPGQESADDRPQRRAGSNQPEQPLGLPGVEQRAGVAPRMDRGDHPEAVDPDVEDGGQTRGRVVAEGVPEQQDVEAEEEQRRRW